MIIDFLVQIEPRIQADITDFAGIAIVIATYFWMKNRRPKNRKIEETHV